MATADEKAIKVGYSCDVEKRRKELQTGNGKKVMILWAIRLSTKNARAVEAQVHVNLKGTMYHSNGEWYNISPETIKAIILSEIEKRKCKASVDLQYGLIGALGLKGFGYEF